VSIITYLSYFLIIITLGFVIGTLLEKRHYQDIAIREEHYLTLPAVTSQDIEDPAQILEAEMVSGSVVVSLDYFKRFLAGLRKIVGGRIKSYETILDRGRREAILRLKHKAKLLNADIILNLRFQTSNIGMVSNKKRKGKIGCFEVLAYGTAVKLKK
jgi:uncharacterized protein YbjQ (UPF0145 family)